MHIAHKKHKYYKKRSEQMHGEGIIDDFSCGRSTERSNRCTKNLIIQHGTAPDPDRSSGKEPKQKQDQHQKRDLSPQQEQVNTN